MYITSTGMVCPVGLNAEAACAAMRAGIARFEELPYLDNDGEPIVGAMTPGLDADLKFEQRLVEMLAAAISDCLKGQLSTSLETIPLLVGLPESGRPGAQDTLADRVIGQVQEKLQLQFHPLLSRTISKGHTAGFEALGITRNLLKDQKASICLVCGVDSYINARSLLWLDQNWRLKTGENSDGVIPGEAAAAVLIQRQGTSERKASIKIAGLGFDKERASVLSEEPLLGQGLTKAARTAMAEAGIQIEKIGFRLTDVTGESYGYKEQALVLSRLMRVRREEFPLWHCAENFGDTGAAVGIIQMLVAFYAFQKCYAPGKSAMCFTSADSGERAVALLALNQ